MTLTDRTLGINYDADFASRQPEHYWDHAEFTSVAKPQRLIITHDAKVYRDGKPLSLAEVFQLIDELAKVPAEKRKGDLGVPPLSRLHVDFPVASLSFSLPPPNKYADSLDMTPASLLESFTVYAATKKVQVSSTW